jgi:VIT1/CCC1 family predicted Fe2+/Mn2+ transporter
MSSNPHDRDAPDAPSVPHHGGPDPDAPDRLADVVAGQEEIATGLQAVPTVLRPIVWRPQRTPGSAFWTYWTGQTISTFGSSITTVVLPLLIFQLTHSALNLSFTVVASVLPYLLFGLVIGA